MSRSAEEVAAIRDKYVALSSVLNEASRRRWAAAEARAIGRGGVSLVAAATGVSMPTIRKGMRELQQGVSLPLGRIRRSGAGRKPLLDKDASLLKDLTALLKTRSVRVPLQWVAQTPAQLLRTLHRQGHHLSQPSLLQLLAERGYKWNSSASDEQHAQEQSPLRWHYVFARLQQFLRCGQPVLTLEFQRSPARMGPRVHNPSARSELLKIGASQPHAKQLRLGATPTPPMLTSLGLHCYFGESTRAATAVQRDLLVLIKQSRSHSLALLWQQECERLAKALQLNVQLVLLPCGIYRWQALDLALTCQIQRARSRHTHSGVTVSVAAVPAQLPLRQKECARLYQQIYPQGLLTTQSRSDWLFTAKYHPS